MLDIERVVYDMARLGANTFGTMHECTRLHLEPSKMRNECLWRRRPGQQTLTNCAHEKNVCEGD